MPTPWMRKPAPIGTLKPALGNVALVLAMGSVLLARWDFGVPGIFAVVVAVMHLRETAQRQTGREQPLAALRLGVLALLPSALLSLDFYAK